MTRSAVAENFVQNAISRAMTDAGVPTNNVKLREELARNVEVDDTGRAAYVAVREPSGRSLSLAEKLSELRHDPVFAGSFPAPPKTIVVKSDLRTMAEHFDAIATGKVAVE